MDKEFCKFCNGEITYEPLNAVCATVPYCSRCCYFRGSVREYRKIQIASPERQIEYLQRLSHLQVEKILRYEKEIEELKTKFLNAQVLALPGNNLLTSLKKMIKAVYETRD